MQAWLDVRDEWPLEWIDASDGSDVRIRLTPERLKALGAELHAVLRRYQQRAGALLGPAGAVAWLLFAAAAALAPHVARRLGAERTAAGMRLLHGAAVAAMALAVGPIGVLVTYVAAFAVHGASNPVHVALLHRRVGSEHRATVLSLNSMVALPAGALGGIALGALADRMGVAIAMLVGSCILAMAAPLYLVAGRTHAGEGDLPSGGPDGWARTSAGAP